MRIDVVTLFPEIFESFTAVSFVARAISQGALTLRFRSPRDFGIGKHRSVDDTPYGGGSGMVMRVDVLVECIESLDRDFPDAERAHRALLTPQGAPLTQTRVEALAALPAVMLICGRYEGFDERVRSYVDSEISLGDFVMTGGEVGAMAVIEGCVRLLPGVLGNESSVREESHSPEGGGLLEYPHYTRPVEFRGARVPDVLAGGNHGRSRGGEERRPWRVRRRGGPTSLPNTRRPSPKSRGSRGRSDAKISHRPRASSRARRRRRDGDDGHHQPSTSTISRAARAPTVAATTSSCTPSPHNVIWCSACKTIGRTAPAGGASPIARWPSRWCASP